VHEILDERLVPEWQRLDTLADAITSIDYFLERMLQDGGAMDPRVLDIAEESVRALGYDLEIPPEPEAASAPAPAPAPPAATVPEPRPEPVPEEIVPPAPPLEAEPASQLDAPSALTEPTEEDFDLGLLGDEPTPAPAAPAPAETPVASEGDEDSLIDDEIIEIFLEECGEVLETLDTHLGSWREDLSDRPALTEIRRAFHTLKGSGRMVGATTLGEMAWAVENMLNRVLDHTVDASAPILEVVLEARDRIPALREAFAEGREAEGGVHEIVEKADVLASGGSLADLDAAAEDDDAPIVADDDALLAEAPEAGPSLLAEDDALPELPDFDLAEDLATAEEPEPAQAAGAPEATDYELAAELDEAFLELEAEGDGIALPEPEDLESALAEESDFVLATETEPADDEETLPEIREEELAAEADEAFLLEADTTDETPPAAEPPSAAIAEEVPEAPSAPEHEAEALPEPSAGPGSEPDVPAEEPVAEELLEADVEAEVRTDADAYAEAGEPEAEDALRAASAFDMPSGISEPVEPDFDLADLEPAPAPRPTLVEGTGEAERGDELLDVFVSEAEGHLAVLRAFDAGEGLDDPDDPPPTEQALRRALHTLKGSAAMAEYPGIAGAVGPLERLLRAHLELQRPLDDRARALLRAGREHLEDALVVLRREGFEPIGGAEARAHTLEVERRAVELEDEIAAVRRGAAAGTTTSEVLTGEHMDALLDGAELVRAWATTGDDDALPALRAELDALAERASDAGRTEIAGLATALAAAHGRLGGVRPDAAATDALARAHEGLVAMLDALAADLAHAADAALVDALEAVGTPAPGAAAAVPEVEESPAPVPPVAPPAAPAPATTPFFRDSVADVDLDPEMAEIFFEEAEELLENIDAGFAAWSDGDRAGPDMLVRALHTLKGGARMAGLAGLGDEAHELETWIEGHRSGEGAEFFPTLRRRIDALADHVARLRRGETVERTPAPGPAAPEPTPAGPVPAADEAPAPATSLPERPALGVDDPARADPDVLEPFLEEATELAEAMDGALAGWRAEPSNELHLETLLRALHTLKGGARMAGLPALGEAVHDLESRVEGARGRMDLRDGSFFTNLQLNADALSGRIAAIADAFASGPAPTGAAPAAEAPASVAPQAPVPKPAAEAAPAAPPTGPVPTPSREAPVREASQEMIRVASSLLDGLANLAGESSILRGRIAQQIGDFGGSLDEMGATIERIRSQVRRIELETEAQVLFRQERSEKTGYENFDPLEMDRYTQLQELARTLAESASDVNDLRETLVDRVRDAETLLVQQGRIHTDLQEGLMRTRMVPFARLLPRLKRIVRQVAREVGKKVELELRDAEGELDRNVLERMIPPLEHMLRNAVDHGIEEPAVREQRGKAAEGTIRLSLSREGGDIVLEVADDGGGIDVEAVRRRAIDRGLLDAAAAPSEDEILSFIMAPGFSTARNVTQISGRGVGMDVVNSEVKQLGGSISMASTWGVGTTISVRLPFTVSVNRALMVTVGEDEYAVPLSGIEGIVRVSPQQLLRQYESDASDFAYAGRTYELSYLGAWLGLPHRVRQDLPSVPVLMVRAGDRGRAVHVDTVAGSREIVVKSLGPQFAGLSGVSGATILGDGRVVVILDLPSLLRSSSQLRLSGPTEPAPAPAVEADARERNAEPRAPSTAAVAPPKPTVVVPERTRVLVVDDSVTVRKVTTRLLERQGMSVSVAKDGVEAVGALAEQKPDVMLLDIEMPRMDGFEVAQHVRNEPGLADLPIIMITSRTGEKHRSRAQEIGVDRFLGKPFQEAELVATIEELTGR
jgi:chemosensory pili system protein ChpA (sensor histidine kinase/response regulator)